MPRSDSPQRISTRTMQGTNKKMKLVRGAGIADNWAEFSDD